MFGGVLGVGGAKAENGERLWRTPGFEQVVSDAAYQPAPPSTARSTGATPNSTNAGSTQRPRGSSTVTPSRSAARSSSDCARSRHRSASPRSIGPMGTPTDAAPAIAVATAPSAVNDSSRTHSAPARSAQSVASRRAAPGGPPPARAMATSSNSHPATQSARDRRGPPHAEQEQQHPERDHEPPGRTGESANRVEAEQRAERHRCRGKRDDETNRSARARKQHSTSLGQLAERSHRARKALERLRERRSARAGSPPSGRQDAQARTARGVRSGGAVDIRGGRCHELLQEPVLRLPGR